MPKLYRNDAIKKIVHKNQLWQKKATHTEKKHEKEFRSLSGLTIRPLYTPEDVSQLDYLRDLGFPGEEPFGRGLDPSQAHQKRQGFAYFREAFLFLQQACQDLWWVGCLYSVCSRRGYMNILSF